MSAERFSRRHLVPGKERELMEDPRYRVFLNLEEAIGGDQVASHIIPKIEDGSLQRVVWLGMPGVGKTTCCLQAERYLTSQYDTSVRTIRYDDMLVRTAEELGKPDDQWNKDEWGVFSDRYRQEMEIKEDDQVVFAEVVAVGEKDRGRSAIIDVTHDPREEQRTAVLGFIPDRSIHERASELRTAVAEAEAPMILRVLSEYGMRLDGQPGSLTYRDRREVGLSIKKKFGRMASSAWIEAIDQEVSREFAGTQAHIVEELREISSALVSDSSMSKFVKDHMVRRYRALELQRDAQYMLNLNAEIGTAMMPVYNQRIKGEEIVWPWSEFAE